jgi:NAD(P)-dependent dehydrogenase (short-subunit alcohol dehydrogenase family)
VDILKEQDVIEAVKKAVDTCGGLDILVNNSGIGGPTCNVWDFRLEDWNEVIGVDLTGSMLCSREVLKYMVPAAKRGIAITIEQ